MQKVLGEHFSNYRKKYVTFSSPSLIISPFSSVIFLSIGAGAIFQVIVIVLKWIREEGDKNLSSAAVVSGLAAGMLVMYLTSILV